MKTLDDLLIVWRRTRHPRVATLIESVSARLVKEPVKAKSVPARTAACLEILESNDPVAIGRVLITAWPGTWQAALPLVEALSRIPDDPRLASVLAREIDLTRYHTFHSHQLWVAIFKCIERLSDVRTLPLLKTQLTREKNSIVANDLQLMTAHVVAALERVEVLPLDAQEEVFISSLERDTPTSTVDTRDGSALLAAVHADPHDLAARAVYGDWLLEQKDPRGELISLQLGPRSAKSDARIKKLIDANWRTWVGPLRDWLNTGGSSNRPIARTFKVGFPSSGSVNAAAFDVQASVLRALLECPEWRTFERLEAWPTSLVPLHVVLAHPNFAAVRVLDFRLGPRELNPLVDLQPTIESIQLASLRDAPAPPLERLRSLKRLDVLSHDVLKVAAVLPLLERLNISYSSDLDAAGVQCREASGVLEVGIDGAVLSRNPGELFFTHVDIPKSMPTYKRDILGRFTGVTITAPVDAPHIAVRVSGGNFFEPSRFAALWKVLVDGFGAEFDHASKIGGMDALGPDALLEQIQPMIKRRVRALWLERYNSQSTAQFDRESEETVFRLPVHSVERFMRALDALAEVASPGRVAVMKLVFGEETKMKIEQLVLAAR